MNNNLYQWHDQRMVDLEMQAIRHEIEQANLFRQAGSAGGSWLVRTLGGLLDLFKNRRHQEDGSTSQQSHSSRRYKAAR